MVWAEKPFTCRPPPGKVDQCPFSSYPTLSHLSHQVEVAALSPVWRSIFNRGERAVVHVMCNCVYIPSRPFTACRFAAIQILDFSETLSPLFLICIQKPFSSPFQPSIPSAHVLCCSESSKHKTTRHHRQKCSQPYFFFYSILRE